MDFCRSAISTYFIMNNTEIRTASQVSYMGKVIPSAHTSHAHYTTALFLHGGPGGTTSSSDAAYFNPAVYRVVIFDQRGAGRSTPSAELRENTSQHLVADIEALRMHLGIPKWHLVFGGSWGSCLSLMYTQTHPDMVGSLILRGVFTGRSKELEFHRGPTGAAMLFPKEYAAFLEPLPAKDHLDPVRGYSKLLSSPSADTRVAAARSFNAWDICTSYMEPPENWWQKLDNEKWCMEHAAIECHYFSHGLFVEEGELLRKENIDKIRHIPGKRVILFLLKEKQPSHL